MIKLPKFSMQTMYDSETDFNLQMSVERMSKFLIHYEAFKLIKNIEGSIVECGIFKGTSFVRFGVLRDAYKKTKSKLIGFDVFNDIYQIQVLKMSRSIENIGLKLLVLAQFLWVN